MKPPPMINIKELKAARKFGPGYFIREQMEIRNWTQEDLAEVLGITGKHLNKILQEKQPLSLDMAKVLGEVFNTSAQYWINIDTGYRLWLDGTKSVEEESADMKSIIYGRMPILDMIKKGWIKKPTTLKELEKVVLEFWNIQKLNFEMIDKNIVSCLTRKSDAFNQYNASYAATWYQMARKVASKYKAVPYDKKALRQLFDNLHHYTYIDNGIEQFIKELNKTGVIFFVLPHLNKTYLDGAAFMFNKNPVVVYTGRYKRIDNFWFTIAHEIAHVLEHLNNERIFVLDNLREVEENDIEKEATDMASQKLKHIEITQFLNPYMHYLTTSKVEECAAKYEVHPSIIVGQLAYDKSIGFRHIHIYNENVLGLIPDQYQINPMNN